MLKKTHRIKNRAVRSAALLLTVIIMASQLFSGHVSFADDGDTVTKKYGEYDFVKISNPSSGSRQADGINTNDETGFSANRLNSYAWAVASRGDYIYIGTNRTLFGSALYALAETMRGQGLPVTDNIVASVAGVLSGGDVPVELDEEDFVPQIIRFDVKNGTTKVIYQPQTARGEDNRLYYTDKNGQLIKDADVASETASFRSVVEFEGNLYFGSLGVNMLQLVRIDENDDAEVVFQTIGLISSLRAGCIHDDGDGETVYFGGQDTTYGIWRQHLATHPGEARPLPIVIRYLDPLTAGTENEDWSGMIADFTDFGKYAYASVYANGGGNVWDLCSYNGKLYLILAYDGGWALFRGEKGGDAPNKFGWTWTEVVGDNGKYPLAMDPEIAKQNATIAAAYGCAEYGGVLNGTGILESTATPYVYNGKMYIGTFDNATALQSQTMTKLIRKFGAIANYKETGSFGPTLTQIFAPFYQALSHPQHIWVMDENEEIVPVESANELLKNTNIDYVWRFIEHNGKLYAGTFDASTAYIYYIDFSINSALEYLRSIKDRLPENVKSLLDSTLAEDLKAAWEDESARRALIKQLSEEILNIIPNETTRNMLVEIVKEMLSDKETFQKWAGQIRKVWSDPKIKERLSAQLKERLGETFTEEKIAEIIQALHLAIENSKEQAEEGFNDPESEDIWTTAGKKVIRLATDIEKYLNKEITEEELIASRQDMDAALQDIIEFIGEIPDGVQPMIDLMRSFADIEGLRFLAEARALAKNTEKGFDLLVTEDGITWEKITADGLGDPYNYGARTFTICNDELYVGTANPYYGAQLWKITGPGTLKKTEEPSEEEKSEDQKTEDQTSEDQKSEDQTPEEGDTKENDNHEDEALPTGDVDPLAGIAAVVLSVAGIAVLGKKRIFEMDR